MSIRTLIIASKEMRALLSNHGHRNILWTRTQPKTDLMPIGGGFGKIFKMSTVREYWETIPIVVAIVIAACMPIVQSVVRASRMEDISFCPSKKMKCQQHRWILQGPPKPTLYIVHNNKWVWPQGLIDALQDSNSNGRQNCKKKE